MNYKYIYCITLLVLLYSQRQILFKCLIFISLDDIYLVYLDIFSFDHSKGGSGSWLTASPRVRLSIKSVKNKKQYSCINY